MIQSRPEDETSNDEYRAFLKYSELPNDKLVRHRGEQASLGWIDLSDYSGIFIGGGPFNMSDPEVKKSDVQKRFEKEIMTLLDQVVAKDYPMLAACYGIGVVTRHQEGVLSTKYGEDVGGVDISMTVEGAKDKILNGLSNSFRAFVGHKEACEELPISACLLASSEACPVQMYRVKNNIYVTQFHPELDSNGLEVRINTYKHHGYFAPEEAEELIAKGHAESISEPGKILANFVKIYAKS